MTKPTRYEVLSYRQAYDAGLPVAVPHTGKLPVGRRRSRRQRVVRVLVGLGVAGCVLVLLVLVVVRLAGVQA